jgi:hypothetical protein
LSYVVTGGNTDTSTFSFGDTLKRSWAKDALTIKAFALSSHATTSTMTAQGTETEYTVLEQKTSNLVAENFLLSTEYDHQRYHLHDFDRHQLLKKESSLH